MREKQKVQSELTLKCAFSRILLRLELFCIIFLTEKNNVLHVYHTEVVYRDNFISLVCKIQRCHSLITKNSEMIQFCSILIEKEKKLYYRITAQNWEFQKC